MCFILCANLHSRIASVSIVRAHTQAKSGKYALAQPSSSAFALTGIIEKAAAQSNNNHNEGVLHRRAHAPHPLLPLYLFISKRSDHML
jgi:hypothetical protein